MSISRRSFLKSGTVGASLALSGVQGLAVPRPEGDAARSAPLENATHQVAIPRIEEMPNLPQPFKMRDWRQVAKDFDAWAFDLNAKGEYMPLIWIDKSHVNFDEDCFGLYVSVADPRMGPKEYEGQYHDGCLLDIPAVLGATMVGIDKSHQNGYDWVSMCKAFFNRANGRNVVMQLTQDLDAWKVGGGYGIDFWQDLFPSMLFFQLGHYYPQEPKFDDILRSCADQFQKAAGILKNSPRGFGYSTFDFKTMKPVVNKICPKTGQPDTAGAFAWLQYMAYRKFKDPQYLETAAWTLDTLLAHNQNPRYEGMFIPDAAYVSARMNAESGHNYDTRKLVNWSFAPDSYVTPHTEVLVRRFGDYDVSGLFAWVYERGYLMETFQLACPLVPMVRYDARFARAIGKWLLNAANSARLFYPEELPDADQAAPEYKSVVKNVCGYEALTVKDNIQLYAERDNWECYRPDGTRYVFPKVSNFSLYGSSHVGIFGGIISPTDDEKILQLDCLKTDFFRDKAYPTYLYFNPYAEDKEIHIEVGPEGADVYDTVSKRWVKRNAHGRTSLGLPKDSAAVIVLAPAGGKAIREQGRLLVDGVVVDYQSPGSA
jgi:hypothetical protein